MYAHTHTDTQIQVRIAKKQKQTGATSGAQKQGICTHKAEKGVHRNEALHINSHCFVYRYAEYYIQQCSS